MAFFTRELGESIAIDLGTANILAHRKGHGIVFNEPSVVAISDEGGRQRVLAVGQEAKRMVGRTPGNIRAIRPMREGVIADFDVAEQLIAYVIGKVRQGRRLRRPQIAVSVPSGSTPVERKAIREAAEAAGARKVFLVDEPMAAAIGAGLPVADPCGSMVVDVGGGTTEVAVLSLGGVVFAQSLRVAGDAMDEAIVAYLRREHRLLVGEETAERIKTTIGAAFLPEDGEGREMTIRGRDIARGIPREVVVHESEIAWAMSEPIAAMIEVVRNSLEVIPPELAADIVDRGLVLTGGGGLLHGLDRVLSYSSGLPVVVSETALEDIALGAGRALDEMKTFRMAMEWE